MTSDKPKLLIMLASALAVILPTAFYFSSEPAVKLSQTEKELMTFSGLAINVTAPPRLSPFAGLICPISPPAQTVVPSGTTATSGVTQPKKRPSSQLRSFTSLPVVSVISYDTSSRTAIINNQVVTEGSRLEGISVIRIEETRVLIRKDGKDIWLTPN